MTDIGQQTIRDNESLREALDKLPTIEPTGKPSAMDQDYDAKTPAATPATEGMHKVYNINIMKGRKGGYIIVVDGGVCARTSFKEAMEFITREAAVALEEATPSAFPPPTPNYPAQQQGQGPQTGGTGYPPSASPANYSLDEHGMLDEPPAMLRQRYEPPRPPTPTDQVIQTIREAPIAFFGVFLMCVGAVIGFMGGVKLF